VTERCDGRGSPRDHQKIRFHINRSSKYRASSDWISNQLGGGGTRAA
jgi:hypothetical protein